MKKALSLILCIVFITTLLPIVPFTAYAADEISWSLDDKGVLTIIGCSNKEYESFPWDDRRDEIKGIKFNTGYIPPRAFENCTALESVTIPGTVSVIGEKSFAGCTSLKSVTLRYATSCGGITPDGHGTGACVTYYTSEIRDYAFAGCTSLEKIVIDGGLRSLGAGVFDNTAFVNDESNWENGALYVKSYLIKAKNSEAPISIKSGISWITSDAFKNCDKIKEIYLSESIGKIGAGLFDDCTALEKLVVANNGINISEGEFANAENLVIVCGKGSNANTYADANNIECVTFAAVGTCGELYWTLDDNGVLELIGKGDMPDRTGSSGNNNSWYNYRGKIKEIKIGQGVTSIGEYGFYSTSAVKVEIPDSVIKIGRRAFWNSQKLEDIKIPESVTSIGKSAFYYCKNLESVEITSNVTKLGQNAFEACIALKTVKFSGNLENIEYCTFAECTALESIVFGANAPNVIPESVTNIGKRAFYKCPALKEITVNGGSIENEAFYGCTALEKVTFGDGVTTIGNDAFRGCTALKEVNISKSITSIGDFAFLETSAYINVDEENQNYSSVDGALYDKDKTKLIIATGVTDAEISIPDSVETICKYAFYGNTAVENVVFGEKSSLKTLEEKTFNGSSITEIELPEGVTTIGDYAFLDCIGLKSVTIPNSVTSIGKGAFENCKKLESVTLSEKLESISDRAFYKCSGLKNITILNSVTSIGESAFEYCGNLAEINIPNSVKTIGNYAFRMCTDLKTVDVPDGVTSLGDEAFAENYLLEKAIIPKKLTYYGVDVFKNCNNIYITIRGQDQNSDNNTPVSPPVISGGGGDSKPKPKVGLTNFKTVNTYDNTFNDVASDAWYADTVKTAYEFDLVKGAAEGKFNPTGNITIAEAITLAARIHSIYNTGKSEFVQGEVWYQVYVDYAIEKGIIAEGQFADFNKVATRTEFAEIFAKAIPEADFNAINNIEKGKIPDVAESDAVYLLYNAGILAGSDEAHSFKPDTNIQRSEVATIVTRIVDKEKRVTFEIQ